MVLVFSKCSFSSSVLLCIPLPLFDGLSKACTPAECVFACKRTLYRELHQPPWTLCPTASLELFERVSSFMHYIFCIHWVM